MSDSEQPVAEVMDSTPEKEQVLPALDDSLLSLEKIDRTSPELWPEQIPGVTEYVSANMSAHSSSSTLPVWLSPLSSEDIDIMHRLAAHSTKGLIVEIKTLHDMAYALGVEESREMTRGRYLKIFSYNQKSSS